MAWNQQNQNWTYSDPRDATSLAWHEAGHALASHVLGRQVNRIYIRPGCIQDAGGTECVGFPLALPSDLQTIEELLAAFLPPASVPVAGVVAEFIQAGGAPPVPRFPTIQYGDYFAFDELFKQFQENETALNASCQTAQKTSREELLAKACDHAYEVLNVRLQELRGLAESLESKLDLDVLACKTLLP